jgi:anti-sigma factor ChrR (cupin superfamily)
MTKIEAAEDDNWTIKGAGGITAPVKGSQHYSCSPAQWQATGTEGFWIKPLYEDPERGEKTMLMKVDPGAFAPSHTHEGEFEQVYVLEGSFYDQHRTMKTGDYCCRAPDAPHIAGSEEGAVVMVIYTRRDKDER